MRREGLSTAGLPLWFACLFVALLWLAGSWMDCLKYLPQAAGWLLALGTTLVILVLLLVSRAALVREVRVPSYSLAIVWLIMVLAYAVIHPIADSHTITVGNDSENALFVGAHKLLHLHYPYYERTYLHNPITPMPGALILDTPFVALGQTGLQGLLWLGCFSALVLRLFRRGSTALLCLLLVLANAHTFVNLMTGADYPVNCFYICVSTFWFVQSTWSQKGFSYWTSSFLLGLALSSRLTYPLLIPLILLGYLTQELGFAPALKRLAQPLLISAALTLPFFLYDPQHFSPLHVANFLSAMTPHHQKAVFRLLVGSALTIAGSSFLVRMTLPRVYLLAGLASAVILLPPGLIAAFHERFTVNGVLSLGYTDTAYIFLCIWTCHALENKTDVSHEIGTTAAFGQKPAFAGTDPA